MLLLQIYSYIYDQRYKSKSWNPQPKTRTRHSLLFNSNLLIYRNMASSTPKQGYNIIFYYTSYPLAIHSKTLYPPAIHSKIPINLIISQGFQWETITVPHHIHSMWQPQPLEFRASSGKPSLSLITYTLCGSLNLLSLHHIHSMWQPQPCEFTSHLLNVAASTS